VFFLDFYLYRTYQDLLLALKFLSLKTHLWMI
jgi:hypothetical protein